MNHLPRLFLAPDSVKGRIGTLMGEFRGGVRSQDSPATLRCGARHYLSVDGYTVCHPQVLASIQ